MGRSKKSKISYSENDSSKRTVVEKGVVFDDEVPKRYMGKLSRLRALFLSLIIVSLAISCSDEEDETINTDNELKIEGFYYEEKTIQVRKGEDFTTGKIIFPEEFTGETGITFKIKEVLNGDGKRVSAFLKQVAVVEWTSEINKSQDITVDAILAKYNPTEYTTIYVNPETGEITFYGAGTTVLTEGTYTVDLTVTYEGTDYRLSNVITFDLVEGSELVQVAGNWKYASFSNPVEANTSYRILSGNNLSEFIEEIGTSNYKNGYGYLVVKLVDARGKYINWSQELTQHPTQNTFEKNNPWVKPIYTDDAIVIPYPIDVYPVVAEDRVVHYTIPAENVVAQEEVELEINIKVPTADIYEFVIDLSAENDKEPLLIWPSGKKIHSPYDLRNVDFTNPNSSTWSYYRMDWSDNFVVFWHPGYGLNPANAPNAVDIKDLLSQAEEYYTFYRETMNFLEPVSKADTYRTMIMLQDGDEWAAYGSGYDFTCGAIWINYGAANSKSTIAHEIAHTFQYLIACDGAYGFSGNYNYIGQFWEQSAQYQANLIYPTGNFGYIPEFIAGAHLNFAHAQNRYSSYYLMAYWEEIHGIEILGRVWKGALKGEDSVEAYKRVTGITQDQFNDQVFIYACKNLTFDYLQKNYYSNYILHNSYIHSTTVNPIGNEWYQVDPSNCVQNYGFNALQVTVPAGGTVVEAEFEGIRGDNSYNTSHDDIAGWQWGFVAINSDKIAFYGECNKNDAGQISFTIPAGENISRLYFVVTGAPTEHFHHIWDEKNPQQDEQYPWKVKFTNTTPIK